MCSHPIAGSTALPKMAATYSADDCAELLDCARYGEEQDLVDLKQLLERGVPVDHTDEDGNTALHKASANGHLSVVQALLAAGAAHLPNSSGNSPLHWAVQQGQVAVAQALLAHYPDIDVLAQNSFGRSCSTEAFAKGEPRLVELMLAHSSAKKLEPEQEGGEGAKEEEEEEDLVLGAEDLAPEETSAEAAEVSKALEDAALTEE